jgi:putative ABC transport system permease protein
VRCFWHADSVFCRNDRREDARRKIAGAVLPPQFSKQKGKRGILMHAWRCAILQLRRKPGKTLLLTGIICLISMLVLTSLLLVAAARRTTAQMQETLLSVFTLQRDAYNADLYDIYAPAQGDDAAFYTGPRLTRDLYETVLDTEGVADGNWERRNWLTYEFSDHLTLVSGTFLHAIENGNYEQAHEAGTPFGCLISSEAIWCYANVNTRLHGDFVSGRLQLRQGRHIVPEDMGVVMISEDLAEKNHLQIGDVLHIGESYLKQEFNQINPPTPEWYDIDRAIGDPDFLDSREFIYEVPVEIVGLFSVETPPRKYFESEDRIPQNMILTDWTTFQTLNDKAATYRGRKDSSMNYMQMYPFERMTFELAPGATLEQVREAIVQRMPETQQLAWVTNEGALEASAAPLVWLGNMVQKAGIAVLCAGLVLLVLVLLFWRRTRQREMGAMLAMGVPRRRVLTQFLLEGCLIALVAVALSIPLAGAAARGMEAELMADAVVQSDQQAMLEAGEFTGQPVDHLMRSTFTQYYNFMPDSIEIQMTPGVLLVHVLLMLGVTILAVTLANLPALFRKPRALLLTRG